MSERYNGEADHLRRMNRNMAAETAMLLAVVRAGREVVVVRRCGPAKRRAAMRALAKALDAYSTWEVPEPSS